MWINPRKSNSDQFVTAFYVVKHGFGVVAENFLKLVVPYSSPSREYILRDLSRIQITFILVSIAVLSTLPSVTEDYRKIMNYFFPESVSRYRSLRNHVASKNAVRVCIANAASARRASTDLAQGVSKKRDARISHLARVLLLHLSRYMRLCRCLAKH